jgi:ribose 5-phosphate isomerase B
MRIVISSDHAAIPLKKQLKEQLTVAGHTVTVVGALSESSYDYPDAADELAQLMSSGGADLGIAICGTGVGISIGVNRYPQLRCALCTNEFMARMSREHNDANVLALGSRVVGSDLAWSIVQTFLNTPTSTEPRHVARRQKLGLEKLIS